VSTNSTELFFQACRWTDPLRVSIEAPDPPSITEHSVHQPFALVGSDPRMDVRLNDAQVNRRHAYVQLVGGKVFCVDLQSKSGIQLQGRTRRSEIIEPGEALRIGPYWLRVLSTNGGLRPPADYAARKFSEEEELPEVALEFVNRLPGPTVWRMTTMLALVGRAPLCRVRLVGASVSRFHCSLVRTPLGLWVVDLFGKGGIRVNDSPVRSARLYFNAWAAGLGVIFGHDGGNVDALQQLPTLGGIANVDAGRDPTPFHRISSRAAPHNEYTATPQLRSDVSLHGGSLDGAPPALPHKDDAPAGRRPAAFALHIAFSSPDYNVDWRYDHAANDYLRSMGGTPHVEATTGEQLTAKNIVVMYTRETSAYDPFTPGSIHLQTEGTGPATVYRDGQAISGSWSKPSVQGSLQWLDAGGRPIDLNRGTTWIEVVPVGTPVTTS